MDEKKLEKSREIVLPLLKSTRDQVIVLPSSKSIHNRATIVNYLANNSAEILHPSNANDSVLIESLITSQEAELDAQDAGTTFRFLTGLLAVTGKTCTLTGSSRMKERPIGDLVNALKVLGAQISYLEKEGFPPLKITGFTDSLTESIQMDGSISSQFISSVMMVAPLLKKGLTMELTGTIGSRPYIEMTASVMRSFGAQVEFKGNKIVIQSKKYKPTEIYTIEPDWSAASYWYSMVAIGKVQGITLARLKPSSIQGDSIIVSLMEKLGVQTRFTQNGAELFPIEATKSFRHDFTDCPDLAQTIAVVCAAKGIQCSMTGLESLRIKETDRIQALINELSKFGVRLYSEGDEWKIKGQISIKGKEVRIATYKDHRMAMSFAPLCTLMRLTIENPSVVSKSYPHFWTDLDSIRA